MFLNGMLLVVIAVSGGLVIATSIFAFIEKIGLIQRITARSKTGKKIRLYQNMVVFGVIFGNFNSLFHLYIPVRLPGAILFGLFSGVYAGCLSMAIAETLDFIPYFFYKSKLKFGLSVFIIAIALGKGAGALYQLLVQA